MKYIILLLMFTNLLLAKYSITFKEISTESGLSNYTVNTILQDEDGYLWIGTLEGVDKYDGYNFKSKKHNHDNKNSITGNRVYSLIYDNDNIWIGLYDGGLNKLNLTTNKVKRYKIGTNKKNSITSKHVRHLLKDNKGFLWVATNNGLNRLNTKTNKIKHYFHDKSKKNTINGNKVREIFQDKNSKLWVVTKGSNKLNQYNYDSDDFTEYDFGIKARNIVTVIDDNKNNKLIVGTRDDALSIVDLKTKESEHLYFRKNGNELIKESLIKALYLESEDNLLWIGTEKGLFTYNTLKKEFKSVRGFEKMHIRTLFKDRMGVLWIGTLSKGLIKLNKNSLLINYIVHKKDDPNSLIDNIVWGIYEDSKGNFWVSSTNGLTIFDKNGKSKKYKHCEKNNYSICESNLTSILEIDEGLFWLGTYGSGINIFTQEDEKFINITKDNNKIQGLGSNYISKIFKDSQKNIWIGTYDGGLNLYSKEKNKFLSFQDKLKSNQIRDIIELKNKEIWIATYGNGLFSFKDGKFTNYLKKFNEEVSLISNSFYSIAYDEVNNFIWGATESGVAVFDLKTKKFLNLSFLNKINEKVLIGALIDKSNNIWFSSTKGLFWVKYQEEKVLSFGKKDGLLTNHFNENSYTMKKDGTLCFGGKKGVIQFNHKNILLNKKSPEIKLSSIQVNGKRLKYNKFSDIKSLNIKYDDSLITFKFALMDFLETSKNMYQYKITGLNENWSDFINTNQLIFTSLKPGKHKLVIRGKNSQDVLSKNNIEISISVSSPFYQKPLFISITIFIILIIVFAVYFYRIKAIKYANMILKERVNERTKELYETNEKLKKMALTDSLTSLKNRFFFKIVIKEEIANFIKEKISLLKNPKRKNDIDDTVMGLFMIDLDHFKQVNDKYGHDSGDMVLKQVADIFRESTRGSDAVIRWGGEEFLVILKNCNVNYLDKYCKDLISEINNYKFKVLSGEKIIKKTCSVGYVKYPMSNEDPEYINLEQSIMIADMALFYAKNNGRNMGVKIDLSENTVSKKEISKYLENIDKALDNNFLKVSKKITSGKPDNEES